MKLTRFRSDWNGLKSDKAYFAEPLENQVKQALDGVFVRMPNCIILGKDNLIEVRHSVDNGQRLNVYRDLYRVEE